MTAPAKPTPSRITPLDRVAIHELPERTRRNFVTSYGIALGLWIVALATTLVIKPFIDRAVFLAFWPAIIATAWLSGFGPALIASVGAVLVVERGRKIGECTRDGLLLGPEYSTPHT